MERLAVDVTCGEFAGWRQLSKVNFNEHVGPFYHRINDDGRVQCAFRAEEKNLNNDNVVHGGSLLTFADYCLYVIGSVYAECSVVTVTLNGEFLGPVEEGAIVKASGQVISAGGSLIFVRGLCSVGARHVLNFSGVLKKMNRPKLSTLGSERSKSKEIL